MVEYISADKWWKKINPIFIPNKYLDYIIAGLFVLSFIIGAFNFPVGVLFSMNAEAFKAEFGFPFTFFTLDMNNSDKIPIQIPGLIFDTIIYIILGYIINIGLNYLISKYNWFTSSDRKYAPKVYS